MGFSDLFGKRKPKLEAKPPTFPQLCYDVAYFVLPDYAFKDIKKVIQLCDARPETAGPFFYVMACQRRQVKPVDEDALKLRLHRGVLHGNWRHLTLEYPTPPPVDYSNLSPGEAVEMMGRTVLAPHFSAIAHDPVSGQVRYFVLGQAPTGGGTTFRSVTPEANSNLGPGPRPELNAFLQKIRESL